MTPLKANTFISFILLFVLLLLSGGAASQHRRGKVVPPDTQRTDSLQRGDTLQVGDTLQHGAGLPNDSLRQDTIAPLLPRRMRWMLPSLMKPMTPLCLHRVVLLIFTVKGK